MVGRVVTTLGLPIDISPSHDWTRPCNPATPGLRSLLVNRLNWTMQGPGRKRVFFLDGLAGRTRNVPAVNSNCRNRHTEMSTENAQLKRSGGQQSPFSCQQASQRSVRRAISRSFQLTASVCRNGRLNREAGKRRAISHFSKLILDGVALPAQPSVTASCASFPLEDGTWSVEMMRLGTQTKASIASVTHRHQLPGDGKPRGPDWNF